MATHLLGFNPRPFSTAAVSTVLVIAATTVLTTPQARAGFISQVPDAAAYAILYEGTGGHTLHITNVTVNGNIGVGGTGLVSDSGPSTVNGRLDFSASNTGQFSSAPGDTGPTSVNYSVGAVTNALTEVNNLSASLSGLGSSLTVNGNQTVNESAGQLDTVNGVTYRVFNITSYSENDGKLLTINGDGSGDDVILNFGSNSNVNLGGDVALTGGLADDNVLWNFTSSGKNISLNNNASSFPLPLAFMGDILAPNDVISLTNANLDGRVWGGDSSDMQIVSGDTINGLAKTIPEPGSLALLGAGLVGFGVVRRRQRSRPSPISSAHR